MVANALSRFGPRTATRESSSGPTDYVCLPEEESENRTIMAKMKERICAQTDKLWSNDVFVLASVPNVHGKWESRARMPIGGTCRWRKVHKGKKG